MSRIKLFIPVFFVFGALALAWFFRSRDDDGDGGEGDEPEKPDTGPQTTQETAEEEKRRIMSEMGKRGAQKRWKDKEKAQSKNDGPVQT